jgi:hypothetical protein
MGKIKQKKGCSGKIIVTMKFYGVRKGKEM